MPGFGNAFGLGYGFSTLIWVVTIIVVQCASCTGPGNRRTVMKVLMSLGIVITLSLIGGSVEAKAAGCEAIGNVRFICDQLGPDNELWRDNPLSFESYQSTQAIANRKKFSRAPVWASFVATPGGATMFVGMYAAKYSGLLAEDKPWEYADGIDLAGTSDVYDLQRDDRLADLEGKLFIKW